jgi:hypothetical protein
MHIPLAAPGTENHPLRPTLPSVASTKSIDKEMVAVTAKEEPVVAVVVKKTMTKEEPIVAIAVKETMAKEEPVVAIVVKETMVATKETVVPKSKSVSHKDMKRLGCYGACYHVTGYGSRGDR